MFYDYKKSPLKNISCLLNFEALWVRGLSHIIHISSLLTLGFALSFGCGSKAKNEVPTDQRARKYQSIPLVQSKYVDQDPSISKDGSKIIFRSGRDGGVFRIYKSLWSGSAWSAPEKLVTSSGLDQEWAARISPDGNRALVQGSNFLGDVISICDLTGGACSVVASNPWKTGQFAFSADSSLFFYLKGDLSTGASLYVASVADPATSYRVGESDSWLGAFWSADASATYALVAAQKSQVGNKMNLVKRAFNTPISSAVSALQMQLGPDISATTSLDPQSASAARFSLISQNPKISENKFSELGNYSGPDKVSLPVRRKVNTWLVNGSDEGAISTLLGFDTSFAWVSNDNGTIFTLNEIVTRCAGDTVSSWGSSIALVNRSDGSVSWRFIKKPVDVNQSPEVTADPCDQSIAGSPTTIDLSVREMVVNRDATAATHTMAWVSYLTGDPEIYAAGTTGGITTVYNISGNRQP